MKLPLRRSVALLSAAVATLAVALPSTALAKLPIKEYSLAEIARTGGEATLRIALKWSNTTS